MPEHNIYYVGEDKFDLPDSELQNFISAYPEAIEAQRFIVGKDTFDIPENELENFTKAYPEAQIIEEKPSFAQKALGYLKEKFTFSPEQEAKFGELVESAGLKPFDKEYQEAVEKTPERGEGFKNLLDKAFVQPFYSFVSGTDLAASNMLQTLDNYAKFIEEKTGIKRGGLFGDLAKLYLKNAEEHKKKGIPAEEGFGQDLMKALYEGGGQFALDLPVIMSLGGYGLPIYSAVMGGGEAIGVDESVLKGIVKGGIEGIALHTVLKGVRYLPKGTGEVAGGAVFGGLTLQAELQKPEGEVDWSNVVAQSLLGIGLTLQGRRVSNKEFFVNIKTEFNSGKKPFLEWAKKKGIPKENAEKFHTELQKAQKEGITPKAEEKPAEAKLAQEELIFKAPAEVKTRTATYKVEDGKIIKKTKEGEFEISREEYDKVLAQKETPRMKALARAHILEKEHNISAEKAKKIKIDMFETETMVEMSTKEISQYSDFIKSGKALEEVPIKAEMPKDFMDVTKLWTKGVEKLGIKDIAILEASVKISKSEKAPFLSQFQERFDVVKKERTKLIDSIQTKRGQTELRIAELKKKGLTDKDIDAVVLENGVKFSETVKVKREKNGVLSAVITKDQLQNIKNSYSKEKPVNKWIDESGKSIPRIRDVPRILKEEAKRLYELPQIVFKTNGLDKVLYDPIRLAERNARDIKTKNYNKFENAGLFKEGNAVLADRFILSKTEKENIGRYYLDRQGKKTGVTLERLSPRSKKFVEIFDSIIKEYEGKIFEVARLNGIDLKKIEGYAPLMVRGDLKLAESMELMEFITRKQPAFFSTKERIEKVPLRMYEKDYVKVATVWIDKMADFITVGETLPQIKYLTDSKEFSNIVTAWDKTYIDTWVQNVATPKVEKPFLKLAKFPRKAASVAALGLNPIPIIKQALTQIPVTFIEGAPPKLKSQFAKDFNIDVKSLPSIKEAKGNVSIQDMQEGFGRIAVGSLTQFDKYNRFLSLNSLLDKSYIKYKKKGLPVDENMKNLVLKESQDKLDLWYGGMTKSQMPEAFRSEAGKILNMFIYPLTSQLNGFYYEISKARGFGNKSKAIAQTLAVATAIAYTEVVLSKMSFKWDDNEDMAGDIFGSLMGNIPILGSIVYSFANDQAYSPSPIINSLDNVRKKRNKFKKDPQYLDELMFASAEMFGLPKQARKIYEGVEFIQEEGFRDKRGKLLAPALKGDRIRAVIRGKYGTMAAQEYLDNLGKKKEDRKWFYKEVEFLQNADYSRKAEIYRQLDSETKLFLYNELSDGQKKKLREHL